MLQVTFTVWFAVILKVSDAPTMSDTAGVDGVDLVMPGIAVGAGVGVGVGVAVAFAVAVAFVTFAVVVVFTVAVTFAVAITFAVAVKVAVFSGFAEVAADARIVAGTATMVVISLRSVSNRYPADAYTAPRIINTEMTPLTPLLVIIFPEHY